MQILAYLDCANEGDVATIWRKEESVLTFAFRRQGSSMRVIGIRYVQAHSCAVFVRSTEKGYFTGRRERRVLGREPATAGHLDNGAGTIGTGRIDLRCRLVCRDVSI